MKKLCLLMCFLLLCGCGVGKAGSSASTGSAAATAAAPESSSGSSRSSVSTSSSDTETPAAGSSSTAAMPATSSATAAPQQTLPLTGKTICIDPGHGLTSLKKTEPLAPNSDETKSAFVGGTEGRNQTEEQLNLAVGLKLQALLEAQGATVLMTRSGHECDLTNYDRAVLANDANADLCIRIHADGADESSTYGMAMLVPSGEQLASQDIVLPSKAAGELILQATLQTTGAKDNGVVERDNLTGFNFATVPTVLLEMGFMSNPDEDARMETDEYQNELAQGMCDGIVQYFAQ